MSIRLLLPFFIKGIINPPPKKIFHVKHKFYTILIYSSSTSSLFKKPQQVFGRKSQKLDAIKKRIFSFTFLLFLQIVQLSENIRSHATYQTLLYHVTKGVPVKWSSH